MKSVEAVPSTGQLLEKMRDFEKDDDFQTLKKIMNLSKHRYINEFLWRNGVIFLLMRDFDEVQETSKIEHDVNALMMRVSNNLVPKIFDLYEEAMKI